MEDLNIINKEDKEYYDNFYLISMYLGAGVETISFGVYANDANQALEIAVAHAEIDRPNVLYDFDSIRDYVYVTYEDEYNEWLEDKSGEEYSYDESWFDFAQEYLGYIYVDGTEYGATQPYFIEGNNLRIEEANDEPIVFDESKKEEIFDLSVNANDIGSNNTQNIDLGGLGDIGSLLGEEKEKKEELFNVNIDAGDIGSNNSTNLDLGGIGALAGLLASEAERVCDNKLEEETSEKIENWLDKNFMRFRQFIARDEFEDAMAKIVTNGNKEEYDTMPVGKAMRIILSKIGIDKTEDYMKQLDEIDRNYARQYASVNESKEVKEETIQAVADIATKIRKARNEVGKEDFNYDEFVSEIKQDTMRLSDRTEQETAATLLQDFCKDYKGRTANKDNQEIERESKEIKTEYYQMPEDEHIIWDSEIDYYDENYMSDIKNNQYQDYLDSFEPEIPAPKSFEFWIDDTIENWLNDGSFDSYEEAEDYVDKMEDDLKDQYNEYVIEFNKGAKPTEPLDFETWYEGYIEDSAYDDWEYLEDDLKENIFPEIDKQLTDDILLISGNYGSNYPDFRPSGNGGVLFEKGTEDFRQYMGNFDRVCITTQNGILGTICNDHDGTVSGQFYTLPDDKSELIKAMGYEEKVKEDYADQEIDWDNEDVGEYDSIGNYRHYDLEDLMEKEFDEDLYYGGIDASDLNKHIDLLKPIKDTISGYAPKGPEGTKTESKEDLDKSSKEKYKQVVVTFGCDDCGHKEDWTFDDMAEWRLAYLEASDSNNEVGDCPECGSMYYNMKDYKIIEENKKTESLSYGDLEDLAKDIYDWYDSDMGTHFDEVQGNEESVYGDIMTVLETKDQAQIQNFIDTIKEADISDEDAKATNIATTSSLIDRLSELLKDTKTEALETSEKIYLDGHLANKLDEETKLNFENADLNALKIVYGKLNELVETIYENRAIDNIKDELEVRLSRAGVKIETLPEITTVNEAFNLAQVVRKQVSDKLVEEFGYDALYENKEVKTEVRNVAEEIAKAHGVMGDVDKNIPFEKLTRAEQFEKIFAYLMEVEYECCIDEKSAYEKGETSLENVIDIFDINIDDLKDLIGDYPEKKEEIEKAIEKFEIAKKELDIKTEDVEYISQKELDDMPDEYKSTVKNTIDAEVWKGNDRKKVTKLYKDLGYDEDDPMILARDDVKGTILKPVKVKKQESKEKKTEDIMAGEWLTQDNKEEYSNGTIWAELDIDPDYIEVDYENEDTDSEWLDKVFRTIQTKATEYDVDVMNLNPAPNGYTVILKGTLQDIVDFIYGQKGYSIDKCIEDSDLMVAKRPIEERFLGPSDEVIADSKAKGLYTEDDNAGAKEEIKNDLGIEPGSDEEEQLDSIFDEQNELSEEGLATEFKVGDVVTDIVDNDTAVIEAGPDTYDSTEESHRGKYLLRFVDGVCKGDAYWYTKGRFELVKDEELIKDALEIYNNNMKPEDNPLKTESEIKPVETENIKLENKTFKK